MRVRAEFGIFGYSGRLAREPAEPIIVFLLVQI